MSQKLAAQELIAQHKILEYEKALARKNLVDFMEYKFKYYHLRPFFRNWHHDFIAEHLKACLQGQITRLIIDLPPSYGKTETAVRSFVSHTLGINPKFKFIYTTYGGDLSEGVSVETRDWMNSSIYQGVFGAKISKSKTQKTDWGTEEGGSMFSTTTGGAVTGKHAHGLIIDDPIKASEAYSKSAREESYRYYQNSLLSRLEEFSEMKAFILLIMQRLHPDDLAGRVLKDQGDIWTHINLQAINARKTTYDFNGFCYTREENEALFPAKHSVQRLAELEVEMGSMAFKTQMQQDPEITEAGYFEDSWFSEVGLAELPEQNLYIMVDPAMSTKDSADDRGIIVAGWSRDEHEIDRVTMMDAWAGKWELDGFLDHIIEAMIAYPEASVEIEGAGGGIIVGQQLPKRIAQINTRRREQGKSLLRNSVNTTPPSNKIPKVQKIATMQPYAQNGQIRLRRGSHGTEQFLSEMRAFTPDKTHNKDNLIDPFSTSWLIAEAKKETSQKSSENIRQRKKHNKGWNI